jgi:outer membrane protein OmpA-like peptidoglycan-associated protein
MGKLRTLVATAGAATLLLASCTHPDGSANRTGTGALAGAATGAAIGNLVGGDSEATAIGAAIGGLAGTAVGNRLDRQAAELQGAIGGSGAGVVNAGDRLVVSLPEAITFEVDSATLQTSIRDEIVAVSQSLQRYPDTAVQVVGHTDDTGSAEYNQDLSERRARAVAGILMASGTPAARIQAYGRGLTQPVAPNDTEAGRAANRRVEIVILPGA